MAIRVAALIIILSIMVSLSSLSALALGTTDETANKISDQIDRQKKQGSKVVESTDVDGKIKESVEAVDIMNNSNKPEATSDIEKLSKGTYNFTWVVLNEVRKNSAPFCLIGVIIGALIYFVLGPRNYPRKKYGSLLMFGSLTIFVIAQIAPVIFLVMINL